MKIAIPIYQGLLCNHFGHCEQFAVLEVDPASKKLIQRQDVTPPPHEPGLLPRWLQEMQVDLVIAGGMGVRALQLFESAGVKVITGVPAARPEELADQFLAGILTSGVNLCNHEGCGGHH